MSRNKALLADIEDKLTKPSKPKIARNQWQHPGEITNIPSNHITMQGVGFPVLGVPDVGSPQMMHTGMDYHFPGARNVMEYPMMQRGGQSLPKAQKGKQIPAPGIRDKKGFIDLKKSFKMDIFTPEGMAKAEELNKLYPGSKFVCTANGCADIASKAAQAYGHNFGTYNAWDAGNQNPIKYSNPNYTQEMIESPEPLPNPKSYKVPQEMMGMENVMLGLNRNNNLVTEEGVKLAPTTKNIPKGRAKDRKKSNDSFDYEYNYDKARGYEHLGYLKGNKTLIHGTAGHGDTPTFFVFDDISDGVQLPGYGGYEPVEAIGEPNSLQRGLSVINRGANFIGNKIGSAFKQAPKAIDKQTSSFQEATLFPNMTAAQNLMQQGVKVGAKVIDKARRAIPTGESVVDYLGKQGVSYDKATRKAIAQHLGIDNYNFSAAKNIELMKKIAAAPEILEKFVPKAQVGLSMGAGSPLMDAYNAVREFIPVNARALGRMGAAAMTGMDTGPFINKKDLSKEQLKAVYNAAMSAQKRTGKSNSGTMYSDYGPEYGNIWGRGMMNVIKDSMFDPTFQTATSLGRFTYNVNPDGSVDVSDKYDFNDEKKGVLKDAVKYMDNKLGDDPRKNVSFRVSPADFKKKGGSTFSGNAWYQDGGQEDLMGSALSKMKMTPSFPSMGTLETVASFIPGLETAVDAKDMIMGAFNGDKAQMQRGKIGALLPFSGKAMMTVMDMLSPGSGGAINDVVNMSKNDQAKLFKKYGHGWYQQWASEGKPKFTDGGAPCFECGGSLQKYQYAGPTAPAWQLSDEEISRQANEDLGMTTSMDPLSQTATLAGAADNVFTNDLKQRIAKENPEFKKPPISPKQLPSILGNTAGAMITAAQATHAAFFKGAEDRERDAMVRNRNAQYNQQGVNSMDRGNYGVGPTDYGLFRPNQMGVKSPEGQYNGGRFFQLGGSNAETEQYMVNSITPNTQLVSSSMDFDMPQQMSAPQQIPAMPVQPMEVNIKSAPAALKEQIALRESGGNYKALPRKKDGTLASSAAGKYQFLWNSHKNKIAELTGVTNKQEFLNTPEAQEKYFDYWNASTLTPTAQKIKKMFQPKQSLDELKMMVHFAGPQGAINYFAKGQVTKDAFGSTNSSYVNKMEVGGEYELSADEIMQIRAMGGDVEFI